MPWIPIAAAAIGAISASEQAKAQSRAQQKQANISAAQTEYSPWTNIQPQNFNPQAINATGDALNKGLAGGLSGLMQQQAMQKNQPPGGSSWFGMGQQQQPSLYQSQNDYENALMKKSIA